SRPGAARPRPACACPPAGRQGDRSRLPARGGASPAFVPAPGGPRQRDRCALALARLAPAGRPDAAALRPLWERIQPPSLVVFLSDFFDEALADVAVRLAAARREVLTVQLINAHEGDSHLAGGQRIGGREGAAGRRVAAGEGRKVYLERFGAARADLARRFAAAGIRHLEHALDRPLDEPLRAGFGAGAAARPRAGGGD